MDLIEDALDRVGHVAVTWRDSVIVWGGIKRGEWSDTEPCNPDPCKVYIYTGGEWIRKHTSGVVPLHSFQNVAHVIKDTLWVLSGRNAAHLTSWNRNSVHALDLVSWTWKKTTLDHPLPNSRPGSWVYKENIYLNNGSLHFDGSLGRYNISTNHWEHVQVDGDVPAPRIHHTTIVDKDTVFLFGGLTCNNSGNTWTPQNDLYILNMISLRWRLVRGSLESRLMPSARGGHTLTRISKSAAMLIGGSPSFEIIYFGSRGAPSKIDDCWILNLESAADLQNKSPIWKKFMQHNYNPMANPRVILDPNSPRLWLIGGLLSACTPSLQKISLNVLPLKVLATEIAAKHFKESDSSLEADELPNQLKREVEANRYIMADER